MNLQVQLDDLMKIESVAATKANLAINLLNGAGTNPGPNGALAAIAHEAAADFLKDYFATPRHTATEAVHSQ